MAPTAQQFTVTSADAQELAAYRWPSNAPKGVLLIVHGYGEHARRHAGLAEAASEAGLDVWAFDHRNHGETSGAVRGSVRGYAPARSDITSVLSAAQAAVPSVPSFLFGHSMGGAVALSYALTAPQELQGLILSSPFLRDPVQRPAALKWAAGFLGKWLPTLPVTKIPPEGISSDPGEVRRYVEDPLNYHGGVRADAAATMMTEGEALLARAAELRVPTLVVHGGADPIAAASGSEELAATSQLVTLEVMAGGLHELHHEPVSSGIPERVRRLVLDFLNARLEQP